MNAEHFRITPASRPLIPGRRKLATVWMALTLVSVACGGSAAAASEPASSTEPTDAPTDIDPEGVLRLPTDLTAGTYTATFDMPQMISPAELQHLLITGTLLREEFDGTFTPDLAVRADVTSPTSIEVELRPGLKFSDGSDLNAEVAAWNILRNRDLGQGGAMADELRQVSDVVVVDDVTFVINFAAPVVGTFYPMLSRGETMMFSKQAIESGVDPQESPVGAGPYMLSSLAYEDKLVVVKNPDYWNAESLRIPTVEFIHLNTAADANAPVNALSSNAIDIAPRELSQAQVDALSGAAIEFDTIVTPSVLFEGLICKGGPRLQVPALADIRVRQALNYAIDRDRINDVVFDGASEAMNGFWPEGHPLHNPELNGYYEQDLDKAKALLEEAGYGDGFEFSIYVAPPGSAGEQFSLLVQEDWARIGVDITLEQSANLGQEFYVENRLPLFFLPLGRSGLDKVTRTLTGESVGNICQYENEALNEQIAILKSLDSNSDEARDAWWELERIAVEDAVNIFGVFGTDTVGWYPDRVGDIRWIPNYQGLRVPDVLNMYVKAG